MSLNLDAVFDLETRGLINLPPVIGELRAKLEALQSVQLQPVAHPSLLVDDLIEQVITAAASGEIESVDFSAPHRAEVAAKVHQQRVEVIAAATEAIQNRLSSAVHAASTTIVKALQPSFDKTISELRSALETAAMWTNPALALTAPPKVRAALASQFSLRETVDAMLAARATLNRLGYRSSVDLEGEFGLCRNFDQLWPRAGRQLNTAPPWGDQDKITYWLTHGGAVWLPTLAEQDARFDQAYGELIREQTGTVARTRALASQISGGERIAGPSNNNPRPAPTERTTTAIRSLLFGDAGSDNEFTVEATPAGLVVSP